MKILDNVCGFATFGVELLSTYRGKTLMNLLFPSFLSFLLPRSYSAAGVR